MTRSNSVPATAIRRSFDIYYRDAARTVRMDRLNARFVRPGSLAFDIGAHVGDRTASFLRLGARVVALEPQPRIFRALRLIHGRHARLIRAAAGARAGRTVMHVNPQNPTVSTVSRALIGAAPASPDWRAERWSQTIRVSVTTLDDLIDRYGMPDFVKIDVEGHERAVLDGLGQPVPALSVEFTALQRDVALSCIDRLSTLGPYEFNLSEGEEHDLRHTRWLDAAAIAADLRTRDTNSGDIYARLT